MNDLLKLVIYEYYLKLDFGISKISILIQKMNVFERAELKLLPSFLQLFYITIFAIIMIILKLNLMFSLTFILIIILTALLIIVIM